MPPYCCSCSWSGNGWPVPSDCETGMAKLLSPGPSRWVDAVVLLGMRMGVGMMRLGVYVVGWLLLKIRILSVPLDVFEALGVQGDRVVGDA